jgi:hypothetical protein
MTEVDQAFSSLAQKESPQVISQLSRARSILRKSEAVSAPTAEPDNIREPRLALEYLQKTKRNLFITGPGGNGKSRLLETFYQAGSDRAMAVVTPTGTAAMNLSVPASTAHSFFKLGTHAGLSFLDHSKMNSVEKAKFKILQLLIIDEISMVNADFLDAINLKLQAARGNDRPFGGVQVFMFGDPYQLPPVPNSGDSLMEAKLAAKYPAGIWFFEAEVFDQGDFEVLELRVNHRINKELPSAGVLTDMLRLIRLGNTNLETLAYFNSRVGAQLSTTNHFTLVARNSDAEPINEAGLSELPGNEFVFEGVFERTNPKSTMEAGWDQVPPEELFKVKVGAQVMFIKNDDQGGKLENGKRVPRWANGHLGRVESIDKIAKTIKVLHEPSGEYYEVRVSAWEVVQHIATTKKLAHGANVEALEPEIQARYIQFPLKLAWAQTIHKAQGQTLEHMALEPSGIKNDGQLYVALSRVRTLEGLSLKSPISPKHIKVSNEARLFMNNSTKINF